MLKRPDKLIDIAALIETNPEYGYQTQDLGKHNYVPFAHHNNVVRSGMYRSQSEQSIVCDEPDIPNVTTGFGYQLSPYTYKLKFEGDSIIVSTLSKYPPRNYNGFTPEKTIVFFDVTNGIYDIEHLTHFNSVHTHFGFKRKYHIPPSKFVKGARFSKGDIIADSPAVVGEQWTNTVSPNVVMLDTFGTDQDGVVLCKEFAKRKFGFKVYQQRTFIFDLEHLPINLFGNDNVYQCINHLGENIRDDGLLAAVRKPKIETNLRGLSKRGLQKVDYIFDELVYGQEGGGTVVGLEVIRNAGNKNKVTGIFNQLDEYADAILDYYSQLIDVEQNIRQHYVEVTGNRKIKISDINISNKLRVELVRAHAIVKSLNLDLYESKLRTFGVLPKDYVRKQVNLVYKHAPIGMYRVTMTIEHTVIPNIGFKFAGGGAGDKGVSCAMEEPEDMPFDRNGRKADMIVPSMSTISRMNVGRSLQHVTSAAAQYLEEYVRTVITGQINPVSYYDGKRYLDNLEQSKYQEVYDTMINMYRICSPYQYNFYAAEATDDEVYFHILHCLTVGAMLMIPINNPVDSTDMVYELFDHFPIERSPVTFKGRSGKFITTKLPAIIARYPTMLLDKIPFNFNSVASAAEHYTGIPAPLTKTSRYFKPWRPSPIKGGGEAETRIWAAYCGGIFVAEMINRNNDLTAKAAVFRSILKSRTPGNIGVAVDRDLINFNGSRPLMMMNHQLSCYGLQLVYSPEFEERFITYGNNWQIED